MAFKGVVYWALVNLLLPIPATSSFRCTFEEGTCGWTQSVDDDSNWTLDQGGTPSFNTGPEIDKTMGDASGYYCYYEASGKATGSNAILVSPAVTHPNDQQGGTSCISFWYNMYGRNMGTLNVYVMRDRGDASERNVLFSQSGEQTNGTTWLESTVCIVETACSFRIAFEAIRGRSIYSDIAIDDVNITENFDLSCSFDEGFCGWAQSADDDSDWIRRQGGTPSSDTGPNADRTTGSSSGHYIYYETSSPQREGNSAVLVSPVVVPVNSSLSTGLARCFRFWYNMYGEGMGTLNVYRTPHNGNITEGQLLFSWSGEQTNGTYWLEAETCLPLEAQSYRIALEAIRGSDYTSDIALDDVEFTGFVCTFEDGLCGWTQSTDDRKNWVRDRAGTFSFSTGPEFDKTTGDSTGYYLYIEATSGAQGYDAVLISPIFPGTNATQVDWYFSFWYSMYGSGTGTLNVYQVPVSGRISEGEVIFTRSGEQTDGVTWLHANIPIESMDSNFRVAFQAIRGYSGLGDIAIDDVTTPGLVTDITLSDSAGTYASTGSTAYVVEGVSHQFTCQVSYLRLTPSFRWTLGGREVTSYTNNDALGLYTRRNVLTFLPTWTNHGELLRCSASNTGICLDVGIDLRLDVTVCAKTVNVICPSGRARIGSAATFSCASDSSRPASTLTWSRNDEVQTTTIPPVVTSGDRGGEVTTLNLTVPVTARTEHGDIFKCCTTSTALCPVIVCDMCSLSVEYPAVFVQMRTVPTGPVTEGGDVVLTCTADANPQPLSLIIWEKVGSTASLPSTYRDGTSTLTLSNITREQAGPYRCHADNGVPPAAYSNHVTVIVYYGVAITSTSGLSVGAKEGYEAVMVCTANGNPLPKVTWLGPAGSQVPNATHPGRRSQVDTITGGDDVDGYTVKSVLRISNVLGATDYGTYTCNGDNGVGVPDTSTIQLNNKVQPSPPKNVSVHPIWSAANSVLVTWTLGNDNGEPQWFYVNVREIETTSDFNPSRRSSRIEGASEYELTGLRPRTLYDVQVYAENVNGVSEAFNVTFTTPLGDLSKYTLLTAFTAVLAVIVFVCIVLLVVTCCRRRNVNRKQGKRKLSFKPTNRSAGVVNEAVEIHDVGIPMQVTSADHDDLSEAVYDNLVIQPMEFLRDKLSIVRELGHNAFGNVFLARARDIVEEGVVTNVAVKTLKDGAVGGTERGDLLREIDFMKLLPSHKNVVRLLGYCINQDPVYIIMEYLAKGTFKGLLKDCQKGSLTLSSKDLIRCARDVSDALAFLSSQHVVHGDVAARNVLVGQDLVCKLFNFEFARNAKNERVCQSDCKGRLPLRWMAPESLLNGVYTSQSDVWSFGVLLWEIVTLGARPYPGMTAKKMIAQIQEGYRMPKPDLCHETLYLVMLACWMEEPNDRLTFKKASRKLEQLISVSNEYITMEASQDSPYELMSIPTGAADKI